MTFIRRQTEGSNGIHMTKEDSDLFSQESKMYVHAVLELEPKETHQQNRPDPERHGSILKDSHD